jgi:hypothetical protein
MQRPALFVVMVVIVMSLAAVAASPAGAATLHMAPGASGKSCSRKAPCGTLAAAYRAARLGDTVRMRSGNYGSQTVPGSMSKGQPDRNLRNVKFRPARGANVVLGSTRIFVPHVVLAGVTTADLHAWYRAENPSIEGAGDVHFRRVKARRVMFVAVKNFSLTDSEVGPSNTDGIDIYGSVSGRADAGHYPSNGLIEDVWIHDLTLTNADHIDGIQFTAGHDVTIRRVRLERVHHQNLLAKTDLGPVYNVRIEDSYFGPVISPGFTLMFMRLGPRRCDGNVVSGTTFVGMSPLPRTGPDDQCRGRMIGNTFPHMTMHHCSQWLESWTLKRNKVRTRGRGRATRLRCAGRPR